MKPQTLITMLFAALLGLATPVAHAILVDQGNAVLDTQNNLLWLDVSQTDGMSYATASAAFAADGWVHATEAQYEAMFDSLFTGYVGNSTGYMHVSPGSELYNQSLLFHELFGATAGNGSYTQSYGWYEDSNGILRLGGTFTMFGNYANLYRDYTNNYSAYRTSGVNYVGVFLVKPVTVPEPASLLLLGLALIGLGLYRRRRFRQAG